MSMNFLTFCFSVASFVVLVLLYLNSRTSKTGTDAISIDLEKVKNELATVTTPINELNRFLGGKTDQGRLGEWSLNSLVEDILPSDKFRFQFKFDATSKIVDCAVKNIQGVWVPIDSKMHSGIFTKYQEAQDKAQKTKALKDFQKAIEKDVVDIKKKYVSANNAADYGVLYIASEKMNNLVDEIEDNFREKIFVNHRILIQGPNTLAVFLDTIRLGHEHVRLNEEAEKVKLVIMDITKAFTDFEDDMRSMESNLTTVSNTRSNVEKSIGKIKKTFTEGTETFSEEINDD